MKIGGANVIDKLLSDLEGPTPEVNLGKSLCTDFRNRLSKELL